MRSTLALTSWTNRGQQSGECPSVQSTPTNVEDSVSTAHFGQAGERICLYCSSGDHKMVAGMRKSVTYNMKKIIGEKHECMHADGVFYMGRGENSNGYLMY